MTDNYFEIWWRNFVLWLEQWRITVLSAYNEATGAALNVSASLSLEIGYSYTNNKYCFRLSLRFLLFALHISYQKPATITVN